MEGFLRVIERRAARRATMSQYPLSPEQRTIVLDNQGLIGSIVRSFPRSLRDDLRSVGNLALCEAVRSWQPSMAGLSTHGWRRVRWAVLDAMRQEVRHRDLQRVPVAARHEKGELLDVDLRRVRPAEAVVLILYYGLAGNLCLPVGMIAEVMRRCRSDVWLLRTKGLERLRRRARMPQDANG